MRLRRERAVESFLFHRAHSDYTPRRVATRRASPGSQFHLPIQTRELTKTLVPSAIVDE